jgi:hypothetical protein
VSRDILDQLMLWHLTLMGGGNIFCLTHICLSNQCFLYLHLANVHFIWLSDMLNDSTMLTHGNIRYSDPHEDVISFMRAYLY